MTKEEKVMSDDLRLTAEAGKVFAGIIDKYAPGMFQYNELAKYNSTGLTYNIYPIGIDDEKDEVEYMICFELTANQLKVEISSPCIYATTDGARNIDVEKTTEMLDAYIYIINNIELLNALRLAMTEFYNRLNELYQNNIWNRLYNVSMDKFIEHFNKIREKIRKEKLKQSSTPIDLTPVGANLVDYVDGNFVIKQFNLNQKCLPLM